MTDLTDEQLAYLMKFRHPEKILAQMAGLTETHIAEMFEVDLATYRANKSASARQAESAAGELLDDAEFAAQLDRLPLQPGQTVVGLGDSITDDDESWLEILRHALAARRGGDGLKVINAGVSGDTTSQVITRFLAVIVEQPDWVVCLVGTNDSRWHGQSPTKTLVSVEETEKNYRMLRNFAAGQTSARWLWMTPPPAIEERIAAHWFFSELQLMWRNENVAAVADAVRRQDDAVVDLQAAFGCPADPALLLEDGLHPSLAGQKLIVRTLVARWSELT